MTRTTKLGLGLLTLAMVIAWIVEIVERVELFLAVVARGSASPEVLAELLRLPGAAIWLAAIAWLLYVGHLLVVRATVPTLEKFVWIFLLTGVPLIAMPIYWYQHVWTERRVRDELARFEHRLTPRRS